MVYSPKVRDRLEEESRPGEDELPQKSFLSRRFPRLFLLRTIFENFDAGKSELRQCPDFSIKKLPPPTPERCERRLFPPEQSSKTSIRF
jgi:hypothetical protein